MASRVILWHPTDVSQNPTSQRNLTQLNWRRVELRTLGRSASGRHGCRAAAAARAAAFRWEENSHHR
jgi:hypothetical protein